MRHQFNRNHGGLQPHDRRKAGVYLRSVLPVGYLTTSMQINQGRKEILLHQAIGRDNDPDDRACRTKLCAVPAGDIEKLFTMRDVWGWHRVNFYGDLKEPAYALADRKAAHWTTSFRVKSVTSRPKSRK
jgi:hypothetical protein